MRHSNSYTGHKFLQSKTTFNVLSRGKTLFPITNLSVIFTNPKALFVRIRLSVMWKTLSLILYIIVKHVMIRHIWVNFSRAKNNSKGHCYKKSFFSSNQKSI